MPRLPCGERLDMGRGGWQAGGSRMGLTPTNDPHPNPSPIAMGEGLSLPTRASYGEYLPLSARSGEKGPLASRGVSGGDGDRGSRMRPRAKHARAPFHPASALFALFTGRDKSQRPLLVCSDSTGRMPGTSECGGGLGVRAGRRGTVLMPRFAQQPASRRSGFFQPRANVVSFRASARNLGRRRDGTENDEIPPASE